MKTKLFAILALTLLCAFNSPLSTAFAQGTAFTYQGQLQNDGSPANGSYDLTFTLYDVSNGGSSVSGPLTNSAVAVTNGLFTVIIDFGAPVWNGETNWLQIGVETNGAGPFTTLSPRQELTPTPYAIFAESSSNLLGTLPAASLGGTYSNAVTFNNAGNSFSGSYAGSGAGVTNVNAATLGGLNATNFWQLEGNNVAAGQFLGSTNNQPLEIRVDGVRAGWISSSNGLPNIVFGPAQNVISNTTVASSILGGINNTIGTNSGYSVLGGGDLNFILFGSSFSFLGGGYQNTIESNATYSFLGGGYQNVIQGPNLCVLVGGEGNYIYASANDSFLGGGYGNNIDSGSAYGVLVGGQQNIIQSGGDQNFLGGGANNTILSSSSDSVLVGGENNNVGNNWAFLGGGSHNTISSSGATGNAVLVGGAENNIQGQANYAFLGSGFDNIIQGANSYYAVIGGGYENIIQGYGYGAVLGGGYQNSISNNAEFSFLGGGQNNFVGGYWAAVGGGYQNSATNVFATVPGGSNNVAGGPFSFAAGTSAQAVNSGAFVWADVEGTPFSSTNANSFNVRANGGVRLVTGGAGLTVDGQPVLAGNISLAQLPSAVVTNNDSASITLNGTFSGNGTGLAGVNAAELGGLSSASFWNTNGNAGANPTNGAFLGTTDNNPLEIHVDGTRGWRMEPDSRGENVPTLIGGYAGNAVLQPGSGGDFIGGGGGYQIPNLINSNSSGIFIGAGSGNQVGPNVVNAVLVGGYENIILSPDSMVGGGDHNEVGTNAQFAVIGGGLANTNTAIGGTVGGGAYNYSSGNSYGYSTVCGGQSNTCGSFATVAGGYGNTAGGFGSFIGGGGFATDTGIANNNPLYYYIGNSASGQASTIGGGCGNEALGPGSFIGGGGFDGNTDDDSEIIGNEAYGGGDVIGGGTDNGTTDLDSTVSGGFANGALGDYSAVPGGSGNFAVGNYSFAAGAGATANYANSFVWSDGSGSTEDTGGNQFVAQASGGFFFYSSSGTTGAELPHGSGSWSSMSDRNAKNNFGQVAPETVLARVASLPMRTWSYKTEQGVRHIGPMAQDFYAAFSVGEDDKHIADVDEGGVALAAIQGLNQKMEEKDATIREQGAEIQQLKQSVAELKELVQSLAGKK